MLVYDETPGLQTGEETSDLLPLGLDAVVSDLLQTEEIEAVCGAARDTIFFDYGMDQPIEGGEGNFIGGVALTQADGSFYDGEDREIGRGSCRERGCQDGENSVVAGSLK